MEKLKEIGVRCQVDIRNEKISYKIREHSSKKVPIIFAIGKKEVADKTVSVRRIGSNNTEVIALDNAIKVVFKENNI